MESLIFVYMIMMILVETIIWGGYSFTPLNFIDSPGDEFPETFQLSNSGGISFVLEVEYEWLD
jgi:hypothetical protein